MESWLYKQGEQKGLEKGIEKGAARSLRALFVRRLGREPGAAEEQALLRRAQDVSPEQLVEVVEMPADVFFAWLGAS